MPLEDHVIHLENGRMASDTPRDVVSRIARNAVREAGDGGIVIHFHGGLVPYRRGMHIAERLDTNYRQAARAYPIFFVWESGLLETLRNNLGEIPREVLFRHLWKQLSEIVLRKFAQTKSDRAADVLPAVDSTAVRGAIDQALDRQSPELLEMTTPETPTELSELSDPERWALENELLLDTVLTAEVQRISNGLRDPAAVAVEMEPRAPRVQGSTYTLMDPRSIERLVDRPQPGARGLLSMAKVVKAVVTIGARVISRFVFHRDHGFHATLVEEILREFYVANVGELIWNFMKKDTVDAFGDDGRTFGGTALLEALCDFIDPASPPRVTLVGHSTGAVYISEFLDKSTAVLPESIRYGVVLLSPASTFEKTAATLKRHGSRISGFRMFTMTDENERRDHLVRVLFPYSLLYFVSGVVEPEADTPIVGMERYYDRGHYADVDFPAIKTVRDFVTEAAERAVWSVTEDAPPGRRSASLKHGDFDNDDMTLNSVAHILAEGF